MVKDVPFNVLFSIFSDGNISIIAIISLESISMSSMVKTVVGNRFFLWTLQFLHIFQNEFKAYSQAVLFALKIKTKSSDTMKNGTLGRQVSQL